MDKKVEALLQAWRGRNIQGFYCADKAAALDTVFGIIPVSSSIGLCGSKTLDELGVIRGLEARGNKVFNQYKPGLTLEENLHLRRQGTQADYFLASANAISLKGELIFFSAYGNRTAGISYSRNLIVLCGVNKLCENLEQALKRAREYSTPLNCKRLNWNSACVKDGICRKEICLFPENKRMCCQILIIEAEVTSERLKVVLVGENLGF